jgi:hypothetical protein
MISYCGHTIGKQIYHTVRSNNISDRKVIFEWRSIKAGSSKQEINL